MPHRIDCCADGPSRVSPSSPRFPDLKNRYKVSWREAWYGLLAPVFRLHRYRNLQAHLMEAAISRREKEEKAGR